jgi:hypothetical protein
MSAANAALEDTMKGRAGGWDFSGGSELGILRVEA